MRRGWSIGEHRVELEIHARVLTVRVDAASKPALTMRSKWLGLYPIQVGDHVATLRRVRSIDVARNELWMSGVRIPHSAEPIRALEAKAGARCHLHRTTEAARMCGVCRTPMCNQCTAVDGVRCLACFTAAVQELRERDLANRIKGPILAGVLIAAIALAGIVGQVAVLLQCAAGCTGLFVFLMVSGLIRERLEARRLAPPTLDERPRSARS